MSRQSGRDWLASLPTNVASQRKVLEELLDLLEADGTWQWLDLGCSIAEGRGDELSDIDVGVGLSDDVWLAAEARLLALMKSLGAGEEILTRDGFDSRSRAVAAFAQLESGVQVDIVAMRASTRPGRPPGSVILYDPDGHLDQEWIPAGVSANAEDIWRWTFSGWIALSDGLKYLRRGSLWEALERLHECRTHVWRLWAAANGIRYPGFGLTSVLDNPDIGVPEGIEGTVSGLDTEELAQALRTCAALLQLVSRQAAEMMKARLPIDFESSVLERLR